MAASSNTKYDLGNAFGGLRSVLPAPVESEQQVYPILHAFDAPKIAPSTSAFDGLIKTPSTSASDGLRSALPAQQVYPIPHAFDALRRIAPPTSAFDGPRNVFDGIIMAPYAPASTSAEYLPYDVFINHHGGDVKHKVANTIYKKLDVTGLRVFLDKDELKLGDLFPIALQEAMRTASLHIAIFSENYAKSPWCLAELAYMLQTGIKVIPVFYHVEPNTLRWAIEGKGIYADAFSNHEKKGRYSAKLLQRWKRALHDASLYTGEIINNQGEEQEAVKNVVNRVLQQLKKDRLDVAKHPVGLDEAVQDFYNKTALQSAGPIQIVGIWGMGGAGKTTLAMELYNKKYSTFDNKKCSTFDRPSFLFDVREASRKELLHEKQKQLLEDLGFEGKDAPFDNVHQGKQILKSRLRSVRVLIVLDDVDHTDQLDALLPARESLGHGSLIIVTTRDLRVLKAWGVSDIYKIRTLNAPHAQQLFCWHAFGQPSPLLGFKDLAEKCIKACQGLPLSLKVLGGQLYGESSKNYWQSELDKFSRIMPDDIKLRLKISYDALDKEEKEMFLDVACFFIGWKSSEVIAVWDALDCNGLHGWQRLVNKCLVELQYNYIRMHDHLRDLGREIANQQSPYRLWSKSQIIEIHPQPGAIRIRGMVDAIGDNCYQQQGKIIIHTSQGERSLAPRSLGLKIFVGDGDFINQEHSELSRELVWLWCDEFQHKSLPSWLSLKKLRILELTYPQKLEDLWECDEDVPLQLRELIIEGQSSLQGFPRSIARLRNLKKIIINCSELSSLPQEFFDLQSLEHLEMKECRNLSSLPSNFGKLTNLQHLDLAYWGRLSMLPDSFKYLTKLQHLNLNGCGSLSMLPDSFEYLTNLQHLDLAYCGRLSMLPDSFKYLTNLQHLSLIGCGSLSMLPDSFKYLTNLQHLNLRRCGSLSMLPDSFGYLTNLQHLDMYGCKGLEMPPDSFEKLILLEYLNLEDCEKLTIKARVFENMTKLGYLNLEGCRKLEELSLPEVTSLTELNLRGTSLKEVPANIFQQTKLTKLTIGSEELTTLPTSLGNLSSLTTLQIAHCEKLESLPDSLEQLNFLRDLHIMHSGVKCLPKSFIHLQSLRIEYIPISELSFGSGCMLKTIELTGTKVSKISICSDCCPFLETLQLRSNKDLRELETLPETLKRLRVYNCGELGGLPSLATLTSLKEFELKGCHKVEKVEGLESLTSLQTLGIDDCSELDGLPCLAELTSLEEFELRNCHKVEKVEGLERLTSLEKLGVLGCSKAPCIVRSEDCERLKSLVIVANDRAVIEPFKQKWPEEVIICTRAVIDVGSLKNFFTSFPLKSEGESGSDIYLTRPENSSNANAILICFIIDYVNTNAEVYIYPDGGTSFKTELANGKWQWMGVFQQGSDWLQSNEYNICTYSADDNAKVKEAWVVMGEEGSILEAFHQLSQR